MTYGIANKQSIALDMDANTTNSRYGAVDFKVFRKFSTRKAARTYKQSLKNPSHYAIVQLNTSTIVR